MNSIVARPISSRETWPLRLSVLRAGMPPEAAIFPGDDDFDTRHIGAFADEKLVGIASVLRAPLPDNMPLPDDVLIALSDEQMWQLRGMAVDPQARGNGYGKAVLNACVEYAARRGGTLLWCFARVPALGFYRGLGFQAWGEEFEIPTAGPHFVMFRRLEAHVEQPGETTFGAA